MKGTMHMSLLAAAAALGAMDSPPPTVRSASYPMGPTAKQKAKRIERAKEKRARKAAIRARARL